MGNSKEVCFAIHCLVVALGLGKPVADIIRLITELNHIKRLWKVIHGLNRAH